MMDSDLRLYSWFFLGTPIVSFVINMMAQWIIFRFWVKSSLIRSITLGFASGIGVFCVLSLFSWVCFAIPVLETFSLTTVNIVVYLGLSYGYFNYINLGESSLRVRIISKLMTSEEECTIKDLELQFNDIQMLHDRIQRLLRHGEILQRGNRYIIGRSKLVWVARVIFFLKYVILGIRSEFDMKKSCHGKDSI